MNSSDFPRVLPGLPGEGKAPLQFSATRTGMHREGCVVAFGDGDGERWIGNFQPGGGQFTGVFADHDALVACVFSCGQGYAVSMKTGELLAEFGGDADSVIEIRHRRSILLCGATDFQLHRTDDGSLVWRARRISWDGFRDLKVEDDKLTGEAWMFDDTWHSFVLNLESAEAVGGSYDEAT